MIDETIDSIIPPETLPQRERQPVDPLPPVAIGYAGTTVLICPDSFKGTLTAREAARAMLRGVQSAWPTATSIVMPLADGGEGTLDTLMAGGGKIIEQEVEGPTGARHMAHWGSLPDGTAVIEMALASGLTLVPEAERDICTATSHGTGRLIRHLIERGRRRMIIGIGGSATNDGGMGAMRALGARFYDADGNELERGGASLAKLERIDLSAFPDVSLLEIKVACDVSNPLCGPDGATYTYGPQKGGTPEVLDELEAGMRNYARVLEEVFGYDVAGLPGAGAAGGMGAALMAFLKAEFRPGADVVMDAVGFDDAAKKADVILTGEGRLDETSLNGKLIDSVLRRLQGRKPVAIVCGTADLDTDGILDLRASGVEALEPADTTGIDSIKCPVDAVELATRTALLRIGRG